MKVAEDQQVTVLIEGSGVLQGFGAANPSTEQGFLASTHRTYFGRALAVVRATQEPGDIVVQVSAEGCEPVTVTLSVVEARTPGHAFSI